MNRKKEWLVSNWQTNVDRPVRKELEEAKVFTSNDAGPDPLSDLRVPSGLHCHKLGWCVCSLIHSSTTLHTESRVFGDLLCPSANVSSSASSSKLSAIPLTASLVAAYWPLSLCLSR